MTFIRKNINNFLKISLLVLVFSLFFTLNTSAQISDFIKPTIVVSPKTPGPSEITNLEVSYYLSDLDRANISWSKNGIIEKTGLGAQTFTTQTGVVGSETRINVSITTQDGEFLTQQIILRPVTVDIFWEANTYVPPLYKGKALPSPQSKIKVIAIPTFVTNSGSQMASGDLFYKWSVNSGPLSSQSGKGKNIINIESGLLNDKLEVSVVVENLNRTLTKEKSITIKSSAPEIILYREDPLVGPRYEKALPSLIQLNESEISLRAEPYYFSNESVFFDTEYNWTLNNKSVSPHSNNDQVITLVRGQNSLNNSVNLWVEIINPLKIRQIAKKLLKISF